LARQFWPKGETPEDPLEEQIRLLDVPGLAPWQIIGIVGDVLASGLDQNPPPIMYIPVAQTPEDLNAYLVRDPVAWIVRTRMNPYLLSLPVQNLLRQATGGLPVLRIRSMDDIVGQFAGGRNFSLVLMTIFACSAMLLAAIGLYGVVAYSVEQRTHELGIRMAMGAQRGDVLRLIVRHEMILILGRSMHWSDWRNGPNALFVELAFWRQAQRPAHDILHLQSSRIRREPPWVNN
jgi:hypothetical protein